MKVPRIGEEQKEGAEVLQEARFAARSIQVSGPDGLQIVGFLHLLPLSHGVHDFTMLGAIIRPNDPILGHVVDHPGRTTISDAQCPL